MNIYAANSEVLLQLFVRLTFIPGSPDTLASKISHSTLSPDVLDRKKNIKN